MNVAVGLAWLLVLLWHTRQITPQTACCGLSSNSRVHPRPTQLTSVKPQPTHKMHDREKYTSILLSWLLRRKNWLIHMNTLSATCESFNWEILLSDHNTSFIYMVGGFITTKPAFPSHRHLQSLFSLPGSFWFCVPAHAGPGQSCLCQLLGQPHDCFYSTLLPCCGEHHPPVRLHHLHISSSFNWVLGHAWACFNFC